MTELKIVLFETASDWEDWLDANCEAGTEVWLKIAKKSSNKLSVSYSQALDVALCFGWIDSQKQKFDDAFFIQRFTPRRKNSNWSQINIQKAEDLIQMGKMRRRGFQEIEAAKADGRWDVAS